MLVLPTAPAHAAPDGVTSTEVSFSGNGGVVLHGTVLAPAPTTQRRPAMVLIEGAGNRGRQELYADAEAFAQRGVVTLIYDKRTAGYSLLRRDYSMLADDALAGLRLLRSRADVDPARLGLWALSEGAFVAPLAAHRSTDVKFLITVGAVGITPGAQTAWGYGEYLRHAGVSGSLVRTMQVNAVRMTIGAGLFPEANFDPTPGWQAVRQPVLAQWGELDREALPRESSQIIRRALKKGGNTHYTIRFVPDVRHNLHLTANGGFDRLDSLPPTYGNYETSWIENLPHTLPSPNAEAPAQDAPAPTLTPLAWYESPWIQLVVLIVFLVAFTGYPLTAAVRRIRGRRDAPLVRRSARWLAATGLATTTGALIYVFFVMATAANVIGPVAIGRPAPWLGLQSLAVGTVVATAATALSWRRHRRDLTRGDQVRLSLLVVAGLLFLPWATYWGLLIP
ncbi:alpha/beta hydrolase family protein [Micromonospora sp. NPDC005806]|uniref:alpha/beta hydrolase family protein n=1 Tax=Micromonospora sp. NPDC005806 TaxID=3364234 RepID=UPI00368F822A